MSKYLLSISFLLAILFSFQVGCKTANENKQENNDGGKDGGLEIGMDGSASLQTCPTKFTECGDKCVDTNSDSANCGKCGKECPGAALCNGEGRCELTCAKGQVECDGVCVDPKTDRTHCGAVKDCRGDNAGKACKSGEICNGSGSCETSCQEGLLDCDKLCIDPKTDRNHCGAKGDCKDEEAGDVCGDGKICVNGECVIGCQTGLIKM